MVSHYVVGPSLRRGDGRSGENTKAETRKGPSLDEELQYSEDGS